MVGNHIIYTAHSAGLGDVLLFGKRKFCISGAAVTGKAGNQLAIVQRHDSGCCHNKRTSLSS